MTLFSIYISKLFKFIVHFNIQSNYDRANYYFKTFQVYSSFFQYKYLFSSHLYFKTFQVYSSSIEEAKMKQLEYDFKTFQVYSSYKYSLYIEDGDLYFKTFQVYSSL